VALAAGRFRAGDGAEPDAECLAAATLSEMIDGSKTARTEAKVQENTAMTATTPASSALVRPFTAAIADSEIDDLKQRLARTRWPNPETVPDWSQGVRLENAKSLIGAS
jgi:hypothetical protein